MNVLGVTSPASMNTAAALLVDGELVAAAEEERFVGRKHAPFVPPTNAVEFCLDRADISLRDVDHVGVGWGVSPTEPYSSDLHPASHKAHRELMPVFVEALSQRDPRIEDRIHYVGHQLSHAASAYYLSGFDEANVLTLDGHGERSAGLLGHADGDIDVFRTVPISHSLGDFYGEVTDVLGFRRHRDEGKVMGLASYGTPSMSFSTQQSRPLLSVNEVFGFHRLPVSFETLYASYERLRWLRSLLASPNYPKTPLVTRAMNRLLPDEVNSEIARWVFEEPFFTGNGTALTRVHEDIAASAQRHLETEVLDMVEELARQTNCRRFCFAGGVALNCVLNKKIQESEYVDELFIQPAAHDAGAALGAAIQVSHRHGTTPSMELRDLYWGPEFSTDAVRTALDRHGVAYEETTDVASVAAEALANDEIVGWFQGRMEFGPRALGSRSILANPSDPEMKDRVNADVKNREMWRPFAPALPAENATDLFENPRESPFMIRSFDLVDGAHERIPAASHVDETARPQTVTPEANGRYYDAIKSFEQKTGVPAVLNTSYNHAGDPINRTPEKAIETFLDSGIDVLCIEDFVVRKESLTDT